MPRKRWECTATSHDLGRPARVEATKVFSATTEQKAIWAAAHYWTNRKGVPAGCTIHAKEVINADS